MFSGRHPFQSLCRPRERVEGRAHRPSTKERSATPPKPPSAPFRPRPYSIGTTRSRTDVGRLGDTGASEARSTPRSQTCVVREVLYVVRSRSEGRWVCHTSRRSYGSVRGITRVGDLPLPECGDPDWDPRGGHLPSTEDLVKGPTSPNTPFGNSSSHTSDGTRLFFSVTSPPWCGIFTLSFREGTIGLQDTSGLRPPSVLHHSRRLLVIEMRV